MVSKKLDNINTQMEALEEKMDAQADIPDRDLDDQAEALVQQKYRYFAFIQSLEFLHMPEAGNVILSVLWRQL